MDIRTPPCSQWLLLPVPADLLQYSQFPITPIILQFSQFTAILLQYSDFLQFSI
jgi:hypothetical protein